MNPFRKILVPVDFSPHAAEAIRYAADLSRRYEASVTLVHVYQPVTYALPEGFMLYEPDLLTSMLKEFEKQLEAAKGDARAAGALRVETVMLQGVAFLEILDLAKNGGFDLIVMGTHGRTGVTHVLMGSVAEKVVRRSPCPVLTVKAPEQPPKV